ncbi:MAG: hypothetical protein COB85_00470 [Bacteroidetes bacterium]|nr:MAG: hypothetical protein COB85_00470 [Bacteroidota bacterium]
MGTIFVQGELIEKEEIPTLSFPAQEVLLEETLIAERISKIRQAMRLGNSAKLKVKIVFEDATGMKIVETTIWGVTDQRIILKKSIAIPICRVHDIKFF